MFGDGGASPFSTQRALADTTARWPVPSIASSSIRTAAIVQARAVALRATQAGERIAATHISLDSLSVHRLEPGHYVAPLLCSGSTSLPFAVGLELFSSTCQEEADVFRDAALPELPESEGLLSLQYVLDGRAQVAGHNEPLTAQAGDTLLSRSSSGTLSFHSGAMADSRSEQPPQPNCSQISRAQQPELDELGMRSAGDSSSEQPQSCMDAELQWDAAVLTVMVEGHADAGANEGGSAALQRMTSAWRNAPVAGTLSQKVVAGIIERAQSAARSALSDNRSAQAPATFDSRPDLFAQLQSSLRGLGLDAGPAQQNAGQAGAQSAVTIPAAMQSLPSDALQYVMSGILGRWFRQHSPAENKSMLHRLRQQDDNNHAEDPGAAIKRSLQEVAAFRLPNQTNRLALIMDPLTDRVPFTFGIEIFERGHKTTPHVHPTSQELFFILAGQGEGFCGDDRFPVRAGDVVVFPPQSVHGIDVSEDARMYCLELMQPNDMFAEFVKSGQLLGGLADDDLCILAALGCGGGKS